jgi:hypothetical protein
MRESEKQRDREGGLQPQGLQTSRRIKRVVNFLLKKIIKMKCKILRIQKLICQNFVMSTQNKYIYIYIKIKNLVLNYT